MAEASEQLLRQIAQATPANEAEVETKIVLHLLQLLGYSDADRADKVKVPMRLGRQVVEKVADFILFDGPERALPNALLTVETKRPGEPLGDAEEQAKSYALWAGTPFIMACNGDSLSVAQFVPGSGVCNVTTVLVADLPIQFNRIRKIIGRAEAVLAKERISYLSIYLPEVERLPPAEFFRTYLSRLHQRFERLSFDAGPLTPPRPGEVVQLQIPVSAVRPGTTSPDYGVPELTVMVLSEESRLFIDGAPGVGKSTLCRRLASNAAMKALTDTGCNRIPIYLDLAQGVPASLLAAFHRACEELGVRVFPELYRRSLSEGKVALILDGLDELPPTAGQGELLKHLLSDNTIAGLLIASRPGVPDLSLLGIDDRFARLTVRPLNRTELDSIVRQHLVDPSKASALISRAEAGQIPDLNSAMTALMAIRIANDVSDWERLSRFELYSRYVDVLHRFFNARTVRGRDEASTLDDVLRALATASMTCLQAREQGYSMSLTDLAATLREQHGAATEALLNCGLITSESGRAVFVHRTFEDFGVAYHLIQELRKNGADGLKVRHVSGDASAMAASALSEDDLQAMADALSHPNKHARKRAISLLMRRSLPDEVMKTMWGRLATEPSPKVWAAIVQVLYDRQAGGFRDWLRAEMSKLRPVLLARAARLLERASDISFLPLLIEISERGNTPTAKAAFSIAMAAEEHGVVDRLAAIYKRLPRRGRNAVCQSIRKHDSPVKSDVLLRLATSEMDLSLLVAMLQALTVEQVAADAHLREHIVNLISDDTAMQNAKPRKGQWLRRFCEQVLAR